MVLKFTVYRRSIIFFFYKPKAGWNSDIWNILAKCTSYVDVLLILVCMKEETYIYTTVPIKHILGFNFQNHGR